MLFVAPNIGGRSSTYRRAVFNADVDRVLQEVCFEIALRYEIAFLEIGTDRDPVH